MRELEDTPVAPDTPPPKRAVNPRLIDAFGLPFTQDDVDFAIPHLKEDIPLCLDPFLLWCSSKEEYKRLHARLLNFFLWIRNLIRDGNIPEAQRLLAGCREPREMGLGYTISSKAGSAIGRQVIDGIVAAYQFVPQIAKDNVRHIEELQLVVPYLAEDRVSDLTASILWDFFIRFTADRATSLSIPTKPFRIHSTYDDTTHIWTPGESVTLPYNPIDSSPIVFAPLDLLRHLPFINYEDYYQSTYSAYVLQADQARRKVSKDAVLEYNRHHYASVITYVDNKERHAADCKPTPLFKQLAIATLQRKLKQLQALPTGKEDGADKEYEELAQELLTQLLYPHLHFAEGQVRTVDGVHIRDLIFYNDSKIPFLADLRDRYDCRQPVFELKNVRTLDPKHVNQLHRYLDEDFGRFGVLVTRHPTPKSILQNTVDLHSSKRCIILCLDDRDLDEMVRLKAEDRQPIESLRAKYIRFIRLLPK